MSETVGERSAAEREIRLLQTSIDQANLRRAAQLSMAEKFRLGADLYDDGIRWLQQIIKAEQPNLTDEQVSDELDRRKTIKREVEERGLFQPCEEGRLIGKV